MAELAPIGQVIDERFLITSELNSGEFGSLYVARQLGFEREVAIKFLNVDLWQDPKALARFEREAQIIAGLNHRNIVPCYAYGLWGGKVPYLVLELLHGTTLQQTLAKVGPLSWQRTFSIGVDLCSALAHAHAAGVVHRDIKPANIFLTEDDTVKLLDFGLSRIGDQRLTATGYLVGTAMYMSPEQATGKPATASSDIYSLGCVLYECIADRPPLLSDNPMGLLYLHLTEYPQSLITADGTIPAKVNNVLFKAMNKAPDERYSDALSFGTDLRNAVTDKDFVGVPPCANPVQMESERRIGNRPGSRQIIMMAAVIALITFSAAVLISNSMLSQSLLICANMIPAEHRASYLESWADTLENLGRKESAVPLYAEATRLPAGNPVKLIRQLDKLMRAMLEQGYVASATPLFRQSTGCLFALKIATPISHQDAETIVSALATDRHFAATAQKDLQKNYELINAQNHVEDMLLCNHMYDQWARWRNIRLNAIPLTNVELFCDLLANIIRLENAQQYGPIVKLVNEQMPMLHRSQRLAPELRGLYGSLIAEANRRHRAPKHTYSERLLSISYPWIEKTALTNNELKEVLKVLCNEEGYFYQASHLAPLYAIVIEKLKLNHYENTDYPCLVQFLHGASLMKSAPPADAAKEFMDVVKKSNSESLVHGATRAAADLLSARIYTPVINTDELEKLANILQSRQYEGSKPDLDYIYMCQIYGFQEKNQLAGAERCARKIVALTSPQQNIRRFCDASATLGAILEHEYETAKSYKVTEEALQIAQKYNAPDTATFQLLALKGFHLAKQHNSICWNFIDRAEHAAQIIGEPDNLKNVRAMRGYAKIAMEH